MNVLVIAEDFVKDEHVLLPIVSAMMSELGKDRAKIKVCKDPRFHGTGEALKWEFIEQAIDRHRGMIDLFLLCVDRDGNVNRRAVLDGLENQAKMKLGIDRYFLAENAWQEIEVWLLAGHDLPDDWKWSDIRDEPHPKERYYIPFAESRGVLDFPGEGRGKLAIEAAKRYRTIKSKCREDVATLESRIKNIINK